MAYADDVTLIGNIRTIDRNADILLTLNIGKPKYMEVGHHRCMMITYHGR
jgi:hypothetical protein